MKLFPVLFAFLTVLPNPLPAGDLPTVKAAIPNISTTVLGTIPAIDLRNHFEVTGIQAQVVQFTAAGVGAFNVEMNAAGAPLTVANFLAYVNANRLADTLVHRSDQPLGIIQGGGYIPNTTGTTFTSYNSVQKNTAITLETSDTLPNVRGAFAMARAGSQGSLTVTNSSTTSKIVTVDLTSLPPGFGPAWGFLGSFVASVNGNTVTLTGNANQTITTPTPIAWSNNTGTSEWFINTVDNTFRLPRASEGGYAAFGRVTGTGMSVVDTIQAFQVESRYGSPFRQLPVIGTPPATGPVNLSNLVKMTSIIAVPVFPAAAGQPSVVSFSVASNSNPNVVTPSVSGSALNLALNYLGGTADLVIKATDTNGNSAQIQFRVTIAEVPPKTVGTWAERTVLRNLPTAVGSAVDIGALTFIGGTGSIEAAVNVSGSGWSVAKRYVIPVRYNLGNGSPPATWLKVLPTHETGAFGVNDFDLDINVSGGTASLRLRTVGSSGVAATARIAIKTAGLQSVTTSNTTTTGVAVPVQTVGGNAVDELLGKAGIGAAPSGNAGLDINGGDTRGLRLRARTTAGPPITGTWSKGTMILDKDGNLYICTAASPIGTPAGTWKKVGTP